MPKKHVTHVAFTSFTKFLKLASSCQCNGLLPYNLDSIPNLSQLFQRKIRALGTMTSENINILYWKIQGIKYPSKNTHFPKYCIFATPTFSSLVFCYFDISSESFSILVLFNLSVEPITLTASFFEFYKVFLLSLKSWVEYILKCMYVSASAPQFADLLRHILI